MSSSGYGTLARRRRALARGRCARRIASTALLSLLSALGLGELAVNAQNPVASAEAAAKALAETAEGRSFAESVGNAFGRDQREAVSACVKGTKRPDLSSFFLLLRIDASGVVGDALASPATNVSDCVRARMKGWRPGAPPQPDSWVKLGVALKKK